VRKTMERPRVRDRANAVLPSCSWSQRADHATSRLGHETAPNLLSCLLPHRGFHLGAEGLSRAKPEVRIHLPIGSACPLDASRPQSIRIDPGAVIRADAGESANHWFRSSNPPPSSGESATNRAGVGGFDLSLRRKAVPDRRDSEAMTQRYL